ncbi:MAG: restriction endonuclease subunit S, partial [Caldilineaceae bacterium]|nr:restriction endonuclease subunit S [Caldilineaceae bacterium]
MTNNKLDVTVNAANRLIFECLIQSDTTTCRLNEIAQTTSGGTPSRQNDAFYGGYIPWVMSGELNDGVITEVAEFITEEGLAQSSAKVFPQGTLVVALYGATVGKTGILGKDAATNQAVCALFPKSDNVLVDYLHWFLRYKRSDFLKLSFGGAQPNISQKILRQTELPIPALSTQYEICTFLQDVERSGSKQELPSLPAPLEHIPRIVARIEALAGRVAEAQRLRVEAIGEVEAVSQAILFSEDGWQATPTPMRELVELQKTDVTVEPDQVYHFAGVYSFGRGVFRSQVKSGADFSYKRLSTVRTGNFVYPKLMAWEGALGVVPPECHGCVVSPEFPVFAVKHERVLPEVLDTYFKTKSVWPSLAGNSTGTNVRRRRFHPKEFLAYAFPLPPMEVQLQLKEVKDRLRPVTDLQAATQAE